MNGGTFLLHGPVADLCCRPCLSNIWLLLLVLFCVMASTTGGLLSLLCSQLFPPYGLCSLFFSTILALLLVFFYIMKVRLQNSFTPECAISVTKLPFPGAKWLSNHASFTTMIFLEFCPAEFGPSSQKSEPLFMTKLCLRNAKFLPSHASLATVFLLEFRFYNEG